MHRLPREPHRSRSQRAPSSLAAPSLGASFSSSIASATGRFPRFRCFTLGSSYGGLAESIQLQGILSGTPPSKLWRSRFPSTFCLSSAKQPSDNNCHASSASSVRGGSEGHSESILQCDGPLDEQEAPGVEHRLPRGRLPPRTRH